MKRTIFALFAFAMILAGCDKLNPNLLFLINNSSYEVTISLDLGKTNDDGSIIWEKITVPANTEKSVEFTDRNILVENYKPADKVDMEIKETKRQIIFIDK